MLLLQSKELLIGHCATRQMSPKRKGAEWALPLPPTKLSMKKMKKALSIVGRRMVGFNVPADLFKDKWNNNYTG